MEPTFGERLQVARKRAGFRTQQDLGIVLGRSARTIRNWETGKTLPDVSSLEALRRVLGNFDTAGDPVEAAVRSSRLTEDRQYDVIGYYKRRVREQDAEEEQRRLA